MAVVFVTLCACALLLAGATAKAQPLALARSSDERALAWQAWIAGRDRVHDAQPALERIVADRIEGEAWGAPVDFALDALIQLRAVLPPDLLARIAERRPIEGLILLANIDDGTVDGILLEMLDREQSFEWFAAANMLNARRPAGYAAHLLTGLRLRARITISESGDWISGGETGMSIGCGGGAHHPGMPPWPSYRLTSYPTAGDAVLALGPTPIYYERRVSAAESGPLVGGTSIAAPTGADRLRYLAALMGRTPALHDDEHRGVRRQPAPDIAALSAELRRDLEQRHAQLVRDLLRIGLLTVAEAAGAALVVDIDVVDIDDAIRATV